MKRVALPKEKLIEMFRMMVRIRRFELKVNELFLKGLIPGTIHLSHGQEGVAVGAIAALRRGDRVVLTHRPHGQALAKGMDPKKLMAEILGREDGCCRGKGGSMHIADVERGIMPSLPIVGAGIPIATGIAFAFKYNKLDNVAMSFFGDGATNIGAFHEGLNIAAIWKLPVIFICENNLYAVSTSILRTTLVKNLSERAAAYGMPGFTIDGNEVGEVYLAAKGAVARARNGEGPTLIECKTYRHGGHSRTDPATYRSKEELDEWLKRDPIQRCRKEIIERLYMSEEECIALESEEAEAINKAAEFAVSSKEPATEIALQDIN